MSIYDQIMQRDNPLVDRLDDESLTFEVILNILGKRADIYYEGIRSPSASQHEKLLLNYIPQST